MHSYCMGVQAYYLHVPIVKGYVIGHIGVYEKDLPFGILLVKKCSEKYTYTCCFPFALRHRECDSQLPVHARLSTTLVSLLILVCLLVVKWSDIRHVMRCGYSCVTPHHQVQPQ